MEFMMYSQKTPPRGGCMGHPERTPGFLFSMERTTQFGWQKESETPSLQLFQGGCGLIQKQILRDTVSGI
jgi:hypothetical protein